MGGRQPTGAAGGEKPTPIDGLKDAMDNTLRVLNPRNLPHTLSAVQAEATQACPHLPTSPYISLHLPTSPYISLYPNPNPNAGLVGGPFCILGHGGGGGPCP